MVAVRQAQLYEVDMNEQQRARHALITSVYEASKRRAESFFWTLRRRMNYFRGLQYGNVASYQAYARYAAQADPRLAYEVYNYLNPTALAIVEQRMSRFPLPEVSPSTKDLWAKRKSKITEQIVRSIRRIGPLSTETLYDMVSSSVVHGWAFAKTYWDPFAGDSITRAPGDPMPPFRGNPVIDYVSPMDGFVDPWAAKWKERIAFFQRKLLPIRTLKQRFPRDINGKPTSFLVAEDHYVGRRPDSPAFKSPSSSVTSLDDDFALGELIECYWQPDTQFPKGFFYFFSGATCLVDLTDPPYEQPFTLISGPGRSPDSMFPDGALEQAIPIQDTINRVGSYMKEKTAWSANPFMLVPMQSQVAQGAFRNVSGQRVDYLHPYKPDQVQGVPVSPSDIQYIGLLKQQLTETINVPDEARGFADQANVAAKRVAFQKELTDQLNASPNEIFEEQCLDIHRKRFNLMRDYMEEDRLLPVIGSNHKPDLLVLKRDRVDWQAQISLNATSQKPTSFIARMDMAMELVQAQIMTPPQAAKFIGLDLPGSNEEELYEAAVEQAEAAELLFLTDGTLPSVKPGMIEEAWLDSFQRFINTSEFAQIPEDLQTAFLTVIDQIQQQLMQKQMQMSQQAAVTQPTEQKGASPAAKPPGLEGRPPADGGHSAFPDQMQNEQSVQEPGAQLSNPAPS